jgi:putative membrane protein
VEEKKQPEAAYTRSKIEEASKQDVRPQEKAVRTANNLRHPEAQPAPQGTESLSSPSFLMSFTRWHPALGTFQWLADCQYPRHTMPAHERFNNLRDKHKRLYWTSVVIDYLVMLAILVGLASIAVRVIWITLWD